MNQRKVPQRSKGNVKPSSSARAAELLAQKSALVNVTEGFAVGLSFSGPIGSPDSAQTSDDNSSALNDPHIKAALKQLGKKDSVTRLKAMREIISLIQNSADTDCGTAFAVWIKGYNRLSMSSNFKVRELSHQTTTVFCDKLGKNLKPFVKSIVPIMVFGESDNYGNVSTAAKDSLMSVFGADKRLTVLTSCSNEILTLCSDLLMETNTAKYIEKGSEVEEDAETHCQRLSCCSLATLQLLIADTNGDSKILESIRSTLLTIPKFWNAYAKHKLSAIRGSLMKFLSVLCQFDGEDLVSIADHLIPSIVNNMDDSDVLVSRNAWISLYQCLLNFPKALDFTNIQKALLPKVYLALKHDCYGFAPVVGSCVSLIFEKLDDGAVNLQERLLAELSQSAKSTVSSEKRLVDGVNIISCFFTCCSFVLKNGNDVMKASVEKEVSEFVSTGLKIKEGSFDILIPHLISFVDTNRNSFKLAEIWQEENIPNPVNLAKMLTSLDKDYLDEFCCRLYAYFQEFHNTDMLRALIYVLTSKPELISGFHKKLKPACHSSFEFVQRELIRQLTETEPSEGELKLLADMIFLLLTSLNSEEKIKTLNDLVKIDKRNWHYYVLRNLDSNRKDPAVSKWLQSSTFSDFFQMSFEKMNESPESFANWESFVPFLIDTENSCLSEAVLHGCCGMLGKTVKSEDIRLEMACRLIVNVFEKNDLIVSTTAWQELLSILFQLWIDGSKETDQLEKCWNLGLKSLLKSTGGFMTENSFLSKVITLIQNRCRDGMTVEQNNNLITKMTGFLKFIDSCLPDGDPSEISHTLLTRFITASPLIDQFFHEKALIQRAVADGIIFMGTSEFILTTESTVVEELERLAQMILFPFRLLESSLSPDHCDRPVVVEEIVETATRGWTLLSVIEELNLVDSRTFQSGSFGIAERIFQHSMSNGDIYSVTLRNFLIRDGSDAMLESLMNSWMDKENYGITDSFIQTGMINNLVGNIKFCMEERNPSMDSGGLVQSWTYKMSLAAVANVDDQLACINSFFEDKEKLEDHLYLNEELDLGIGADCKDLCLVASLQSLILQLISSMAKLTNEQRDFLMCSLITWLQVLDGSSLRDWRSNLFALNVMKIYNKSVALAESITVQSEPCDPTEQQFAVEWREFFSQSAASLVLSIFTRQSTEATAKVPEWGEKYLKGKVLASVSEAGASLSKTDLLNNNLKLTLCPEMDFLKYPEKLQTLLLNISPFMSSDNWSLQLGAYRILKKLTDEFWQFESAVRLNEETTKKDGKDVERPLPFCLSELLKQCDPGIFESVQELDVDSKQFHQICAYLLSWKLIVDYMLSVPAEEMFSYSVALKESGLLQKIILLLFSIMPDNVTVLFKEEQNEDEWKYHVCPDTKLLEKPALNEKIIFSTEPQFQFEHCSVRDVEILSCNLYYLLLRRFPALIRQWWNNQDRKIANTIERFTTKNVSSLMCQEEIQAVGKTQTQVENLKILPRPNAREVVAIYSTEDINMELVVSLPTNHPLGAISIESGKRVGVAKEQWRQWMLQLNVFLMHQNGSLLSGIVLWKRNIDKHLEGVDDCSICMMAIHGSNHQLPRVCCRQCKKKFHSACLYKWFNTSNNASCPLCRSVF